MFFHPQAIMAMGVFTTQRARVYHLLKPGGQEATVSLLAVKHYCNFLLLVSLVSPVPLLPFFWL